jgi:hypothetical protein
VVGKQGTAFTVLGRYNDTDIIGGGMEIKRPSYYIAVL